ncbi:unnamed protein product [Moneuplotes crassus]|uniref:Uncharacterized protein n=1 Tax=Euplotes crassus TaxID=5936 RepID=A0AAD1X7V4_EUPCR|nr:unnamed protein product [Moneuplotes crassus]
MMLEEKYTEIERDNQRLFEKMKNIAHNEKSISKKHQKFKTPKSLNIAIREKEKWRIEKENKKIYQRIRDKKSIYDMQSFEKQRKGVEKLLKFMGDYPHPASRLHASIDHQRSQSEQRSQDGLNSKRNPTLPNISRFSCSHRNSVNYNPVDRSQVLSSTELQKDIDYFMNDQVTRISSEALKSKDASLPIPELQENPGYDWTSKYDHLKYVKIFDFPSLPLSNNRIPLYSKKHNFGSKVGERHVEVSIYKNKFYILLINQSPGGALIPDLIEMYIKQAKRIFKYCEKSFQIMLDMIEFHTGKPKFNEKIALSREFNSSIQRYSNLEHHRNSTGHPVPSSSRLEKHNKKYRNNLLHQSVDASIGYRKICQHPKLLSESRNESLRKLRQDFKKEFDSSFEKLSKKGKGLKLFKNYFKVPKKEQNGRYQYFKQHALRVNRMLKSKYSQDIGDPAIHNRSALQPKNETMNLQTSIQLLSSSEGVEDPDEMPFKLPDDHLKQLM